MSSILKDVKHKIGPSGEYEYFDKDVIDAINMAFATLNQLGAGPEAGFRIDSDETEWEEFTDDVVILGLVQTYIYIQSRLIFDPPNSSYVLNELKDKASELEFRISVEVDPKRGIS